MTIEIALVLAIVIGALVVFALELYRPDFVAFAILALILVLAPVFGLTPEEAVSGFSNPATVTVLAMFILSGAVHRTGVIRILARLAIRLAGETEVGSLLALLIIVAPISAFVNNTAAVAILIPMVLRLAREHGHAPSKLLIPLSYFSQLAGVTTLIGTSSNILASALSADHGYGPFGMFAFTKIGLLVFATGAVYLLLVGRRLLPDRRTEESAPARYGVEDYLTEVVVLEGSPLVGKTLIESKLTEKLDIQVLEIIRKGERYTFLVGDRKLEAGDILSVRARTELLLRITELEGLALEPEVRFRARTGGAGDRPKGEAIGLLEVVVGPSSDLVGRTLETAGFRRRYNCTVVALRKHGKLVRERLGKVRLGFGDSLLLSGPQFALDQVRRSAGFIVTEELEQEAFRPEKIPAVLAIVAGVVVVAALGVPILVTAMAGCVLVVLAGGLKIHELHESIRWDVIILLAGVIPLGLALERTGGAALLAGLAERAAHHVHPIFVLGLFYAISMLLTELISNNATVVVMVPVAAATAASLGYDPRALILAIMFAASTSFSTPVGYQTNTMVFGPGNYRFLDFLKVGGPLNLILAVVTPVAIYFLWGL